MEALIASGAFLLGLLVYYVHDREQRAVSARSIAQTYLRDPKLTMAQIEQEIQEDAQDLLDAGFPDYPRHREEIPD